MISRTSTKAGEVAVVPAGWWYNLRSEVASALHIQHILLEVFCRGQT